MSARLCRSGGAFMLVLMMVIFWVGWDSVHVIDEAEKGVVLRFGKYARTLDPGFNVTFQGRLKPLRRSMLITSG